MTHTSLPGLELNFGRIFVEKMLINLILSVASFLIFKANFTKSQIMSAKSNLFMINILFRAVQLIPLNRINFKARTSVSYECFTQKTKMRDL